ncbi:hypothetical protein EUGRSUZ_C02021 [Eucalyptus grandis]|uniref:Uncharacterized protein n=2 Tax=Eucalyptus grandis TaxID=71139 RepID=A0ACC3LG95_EUCGR|nr:hypothetical protein EUGRSUZ_C02021 [Eucalyptus grandis]
MVRMNDLYELTKATSQAYIAALHMLKTCSIHSILQKIQNMNRFSVSFLFLFLLISFGKSESLQKIVLFLLPDLLTFTK